MFLCKLLHIRAILEGVTDEARLSEASSVHTSLPDLVPFAPHPCSRSKVGALLPPPSRPSLESNIEQGLAYAAGGGKLHMPNTFFF